MAIGTRWSPVGTHGAGWCGIFISIRARLPLNSKAKPTVFKKFIAMSRTVSVQICRLILDTRPLNRLLMAGGLGIY